MPIVPAGYEPGPVAGTLIHTATGLIVADNRTGMFDKLAKAWVVLPPQPKVPADLLDLRNWYLTTPEKGPEGVAAEVHQPALAAYSSKFFEFNEARDGVVCRVWHGGLTTAKSPNPRVEGRECNPDGTLASWPTGKGRHRLTVEGRVDRLTRVKPHIVLAQVHGKDDDVTVFRLEGSKLWATDGDNPHAYLIDGAFPAGGRYKVEFDIVDGVIGYLHNGRRVPFTLKTNDPAAYFKWGLYLQSNPQSAPAESKNEYAQVTVYSVAVSHG